MGKLAVNSVEETKVVETFAPLKLMTERLTKFLPVTFTWVSEPAVPELGATAATVGTGKVSETDAAADFVVSAWLIAVTVTLVGLGTVTGAV